MAKTNDHFGQLLKAGMASIALIEHKNANVVEDEFSTLIGISTAKIQRYKKGEIPPEHRTIEILAEQCLTRGRHNREWLSDFLRSAQYPYIEQLMKTLLPDNNKFAVPVASVMHNLRGASYSQFVRRDFFFKQIIDKLAKRNPVVLLSSIGGMGKTSLAYEIASRCVTKDPELPAFEAVVWVSDKERGGTTNFDTVLDAIADTFDHPGIKQAPFKEKLEQAEQLLHSYKTLLILDNFETITDRRLIEWVQDIPEPSKVLITSRRNPHEIGGNPVDLTGMSYEEAQELIGLTLDARNIGHLKRDPEKFRPLIEITGGNPKAIELAIGLLKQSSQSYDQILAKFRTANHELFDDLFARAWELLDLGSQFTLMALTFFHQSTSDQALQACNALNQLQHEQSIELLLSLAMIDSIPDLDNKPRYSMHPLVRAFAEKQLSHDPYFEQVARQRWITWYEELAHQVGFRWDDLDQLALLDDEHETLFETIEWAYKHQQYQQTIHLIEGVRYYYNVRGLWDDKRLSINLMRADAARKIDDRNNEALALAHHIEIRSKQGLLEEAARFRQQLLIVAQTPNLHPDTVFEIQHALALFARAHKDYAEAEKIWRNLLPLSEQLGGQKYVINRRWLATCRYQQGDHAEAEELYRASLADAHACNDVRSIMGNSLKLAALALEHDQYERAHVLLDECEPLAKRFHDRKRLAELYRLRALIARAHDDIATSNRLLRDAIDLFDRLGMREDQAKAEAELQ
jgi:hypothetical protein